MFCEVAIYSEITAAQSYMWHYNSIASAVQCEQSGGDVKPMICNLQQACKSTRSRIADMSKPETEEEEEEEDGKKTLSVEVCC